MARVEKVFKEKDYQKSNIPESDLNSKHLDGLNEDINSLLVAIRKFPVRSTLTIIGAITVLYIGFKITKRFGIMKENLKKI